MWRMGRLCWSMACCCGLGAQHGAPNNSNQLFADSNRKAARQSAGGRSVYVYYAVRCHLSTSLGVPLQAFRTALSSANPQIRMALTDPEAPPQSYRPTARWPHEPPSHPPTRLSSSPPDPQTRIGTCYRTAVHALHTHQVVQQPPRPAHCEPPGLPRYRCLLPYCRTAVLGYTHRIPTVRAVGRCPVFRALPARTKGPRGHCCVSVRLCNPGFCPQCYTGSPTRLSSSSTPAPELSRRLKRSATGLSVGTSRGSANS